MMDYDSYYTTAYAVMERLQWFSALSVLAAIASLVLSFVAFHILVGKPEKKTEEYKTEASSGIGLLERLARFKKLLLGDILRWLYLLAAIYSALEGIVGALICLTLVIVDFTFFLMFFLVLILTVLWEVVLRVIYESWMLNVIIARNTEGIYTILEQQYGTFQQGGQYGANMGQQYMGQAPGAVPANNMVANYGSPNPGTWMCPSCGETGNQGAFCKQCGTPRP